MAGKAKLTARAAMATKPGRYGDGSGLYLVVAGTGARKWVFRFSAEGRVTEMGLGSADVVTLAEAREKADAARRTVASGLNPIKVRRETAKAKEVIPTFGQAADEYIAAKESEWRNEKHKAQWRMTLEEYAKPLRALPVDEIDTDMVLGVLRPLWQARPETASRLRGRIETVLDAARAKGHISRNEANPARWRGHLDKLLPKRQKLTRGHHAALPYAKVPAFIGKLREREAMSARALEFCVLTAARSGEVLGALWNEVDLEARIWTVPAVRMKAGREHRVPLPNRALEILGELAKGKTCDFIFPGQRSKGGLSSMALEMVLRRMKVDVTTHGFRSSFRDWAGEETHFSREVIEAALAHVIGDKAEQAYRRGDALEKRRQLMQAWDDYCAAKMQGVVTSILRA